MVECGGLENRCTARYRGFESLFLREAKSSIRNGWAFLMYKYLELSQRDENPGVRTKERSDDLTTKGSNPSFSARRKAQSKMVGLFLCVPCRVNQILLLFNVSLQKMIFTDWARYFFNNLIILVS